MKKFCVLAAISAAMFLMISCGGSSDGNVENDGNKVCTDYYKNGTCNAHNADLCVEGEKTWYEVEGTDKKFYCDENGVCTEANQKLAEYCTGGNGGNNGDTQNNDDPDDPEDDGKDNGDYEDGGDTDNEGGDYFCLDVQQCDDGSMMQQCTDSAGNGYYLVHDNKYEYNTSEQGTTTAAGVEAMKECVEESGE